MPPTVSEKESTVASSTAPPTVLTRPVRYPSDGGVLLERLTRAGLLRTTRNPADENASARPVDPTLIHISETTRHLHTSSAVFFF